MPLGFWCQLHHRSCFDRPALITQALDDSWLLKWPDGKETSEFSSKDRIDHIFVSPETTVLESEYGVNRESDHPCLLQ
jgi:endonuclease/exonuclease/phosphatase (EEP) superfamily protein YafD